MGGLKTLTISNNELRDINPRIALLEDLVRLNIEGNPLKAIKPAMRSANAVQFKEYLKMRLGEDEVEVEEAKQSAARGKPNMTNKGGAYDQWDMLIREFKQGTALDLRNKDLIECSPKVLALTDLTVLDLSGNTKITSIPNDIDMLHNLKTLRFCGVGLDKLPSNLLKMSSLLSLELNQNNLT